MNFGLPEHILQAIIGILKNTDNITKAIIFGSRARGDFKYNSDIDIAIYYEGNLSPEFYLALDEVSGIYKTDILDMNSSISEKLRKSIEEQGIEIYRKL
ncbi:nucleotidyltransferase family protein [Caldicellulosiruptoraceae bacterium PP1]